MAKTTHDKHARYFLLQRLWHNRENDKIEFGEKNKTFKSTFINNLYNLKPHQIVTHLFESL